MSRPYSSDFDLQYLSMTDFSLLRWGKWAAKGEGIGGFAAFA